MTTAQTEVMLRYWNYFSFNALSVLSLFAFLALAIAVVEQEVLRAANPELRERTGRVLAIAIYPLAILAFAVIVTRFVNLA